MSDGKALHAAEILVAKSGYLVDWCVSTIRLEGNSSRICQRNALQSTNTRQCSSDYGLRHVYLVVHESKTSTSHSFGADQLASGYE
jgi:hypothetical protein